MPVTLDQAERAKEVAREHYAQFGLLGIGITRIRSDFAVHVNLDADPDHPPPLPDGVGPVPVIVCYTHDDAAILGVVEGED